MKEQIEMLSHYSKMSSDQKIQAIKNETKPMLATIIGQAKVLEIAVHEHTNPEILMEYIAKIIGAGIYIEKVIEIMTSE
jgi:hypothetical protein